MKPKKRRHNFGHGFTFIALGVIFAALLLGTACARSTPLEAKPAPAVTRARSADTPTPNDSAAAPEFNASRAMEFTKEIVAFGPRPLGSKNHEKVENYIVGHLKGIDVEHDDFEINSAEGHFPNPRPDSHSPGS